MTPRISISSAGNTLAPALGVIRALGYCVSRETDGLRRYKAENSLCELYAEDPLLLLGLVKLFEIRGEAWHPSDAEIDNLLLMDRDHG